MATADKALGPRVTVLVATKKASGKGKGQKKLYSFMSKKAADYFGFTAEAKPVGAAPKKKGAAQRVVRGSKGAGSIKVPKANKKDGKNVYLSIPMPNGTTIEEIKAFLERGKSNKPDHFYSTMGKYYPLSDGKK